MSTLKKNPIITFKKFAPIIISKICKNEKFGLKIKNFGYHYEENNQRQYKFN